MSPEVGPVLLPHLSWSCFDPPSCSSLLRLWVDASPPPSQHHHFPILVFLLPRWYQPRGLDQGWDRFTDQNLLEKHQLTLKTEDRNDRVGRLFRCSTLFQGNIKKSLYKQCEGKFRSQELQLEFQRGFGHQDANSVINT